MKILIINRKRWLRGEGAEASSLQRETDHKRCCLGFLSLALGLREKQITGVSFPYQIDIEPFNLKFNELGLNLFTRGEKYAYQSGRGSCIGDINDDCSLDEATREARLVEQFARMNIQLFFSDDHLELAHKMRQEWAYYEWEKRGRPEGVSEYFWSLAEEAIKAP